MNTSHIISITDPTIPLPLDVMFDMSKPLEIEIGCGNGRFLSTRASTHRDINYIGIERMLGRVRKLDRKAIRLQLDNLRILRLEAFYTFYYLLPAHAVQTVYVFFPDPWPKRRHNHNRLLSSRFLDTLWMRLAHGGIIQIATDHKDYFEQIMTVFGSAPRFRSVPAMERSPDEQTEFEQGFRSQGLPIYGCAFQAIEDLPEIPLPPLEIPDDMLPREGDDAPKDDAGFFSEEPPL